MDSLVSQQELKRVLLPLINGSAGRYKKTAPVLIRPAKPGERVITITSSGKETENSAKEGDFLVKNATMAQEQYIITDETRRKRYSFHRQADGGWAEYLPIGEVFALLVDSKIMQLLGKSGSFTIEAPWDDTQPVHAGDYLAAPIPELDQVYRIDQKEFLATYESSQ